MRAALLGAGLLAWSALGFLGVWVLALAVPLEDWLLAIPRPGAWHQGVGWTWLLLSATWALAVTRPALRELLVGLVRRDNTAWSLPLLPFTVLVGPIAAGVVVRQPLASIFAPLWVWAVGASCRRHWCAPSPGCPRRPPGRSDGR